MKPFNLEEAKAGKPLVTRDGRVAKFIAYVPESKEKKIICLINGKIKKFYENGLFWDDGDHSEYDLFMASQEVWTCLIKKNEKDDNPIYLPGFSTKEKLIDFCHKQNLIMISDFVVANY